MWVVVAPASLVVLIILVLCVPIEMSFHTEVYGRPKFKTRLSWLFGLVNKELERKKKKPDGDDKTTEGKRKSKKWRIKAGTLLQIIKSKDFLKHLCSFIRGIICRLKIQDLNVNLKIGLDDPADTGILFATVGAATTLLSSRWHHQVHLEPSFEDEFVFEGNICGTIKLIPIQLAPTFIRFIFSFSTLRVMKMLFLSRFKRSASYYA